MGDQNQRTAPDPSLVGADKVLFEKKRKQVKGIGIDAGKALVMHGVPRVGFPQPAGAVRL